jgi:hypothetical protein
MLIFIPFYIIPTYKKSFVNKKQHLTNTTIMGMPYAPPPPPAALAKWILSIQHMGNLLEGLVEDAVAWFLVDKI